MSHLHCRSLLPAAIAADAFASPSAHAQCDAGDPRWDMINAPRSPSPHIVAGEDPQARLFDRMIGTWDVAYTFIAADGSRQDAPGQFIAGWVLDGTAVQDLWIGVPPGQTERFIGTTIRFFDTERRTWRVTWVAPFARAVTLLEGSGDARQIILLGDSPSGKLRWSFNDITANDFIWRGELSTDNGATWRLREEHHMRRRV